MFALITVVIVAAIALSAAVGTVVTTARDGYRQIPTRHNEIPAPRVEVLPRQHA